MKIGFVGAGVMGIPMIGHLVDAGHEVSAFDAAPSALQRLRERVPGVRVGANAREAGEGADIVFTMLPNGREVRRCLEGSEGLAAGLAAGVLLVDTSSSEPPATRETAAWLATRNVRMMDAPVSGAVEGAEAADLVFMVGGDASDLAFARPVLERMGPTIVHLGPVGAGHLMKTVNNLATALTLAGTLEAMSIGRAGGLDPSRMLEVLNVSTGESFVSRCKIGQHILPGTFGDPFRLALMFKDVSIAADEASTSGLDLPMTGRGREVWAAATQALGDEASVMALARWYAQATGVPLWEADGFPDGPAG